jgi:hypothetical protein
MDGRIPVWRLAEVFILRIGLVLVDVYSLGFDVLL